MYTLCVIFIVRHNNHIAIVQHAKIENLWFDNVTIHLASILFIHV
jgi:hypothetical protein